MLFSSTLFLFAFLPVILTASFLIRGTKKQNALLLGASLIFYAWGEQLYVSVLLASILANYLFGLWIANRQSRQNDRIALSIAVSANLVLLGIFKYANFTINNLDDLLEPLGFGGLSLAPIHLPIGISFFTFQAITYVVDIHRREAEVQRAPSRVALYIALFPQLIAGPIVRYRQIAEQLGERKARLEDVAEGLRRFVIGLSKKVLIANTLAVPVDQIFDIPIDQLETSVAWLGLTCFAFQIYFDFSGYSDMAIGLGRCFGFTFPENFNWPYTSRSLREFWRRWHMTLSAFFRDYVYIPLGGNRLGSSRTAFNLFAVFLLCGLWHGAAWTFVIWGLVHGFFLALERTAFGKWLDRFPAPVQQAYTLLVVLGAWIFFRADNVEQALQYAGILSGWTHSAVGPWPLVTILDAKVLAVLGFAAVSIWPFSPRIASRLTERLESSSMGLEAVRLIAVCSLGLLCAMSLAAGTHNPFIYFRF
ncbi:MAG: membrane-bound O-acyltransferase family protein [bacterium TMED88]|nr:membrane-bound O-acyltransferase family protein [Deltaproteobacteria bacterium]OUV29688.1 MAG: membrane-bound O-acyltransferase family protein [bacterium TMED88]